MKLHIFVPTRGRIHSQKSMEFLRLHRVHKQARHSVMFVVPWGEHREFKQTYPWARLCIVPDAWKIGTISQYIMQRKGRYKVLIDDDFQLIRRRNKYKVSQKGGVATDGDAAALFRRIQYWLGEGYVHGGVSLRQTNHFCTDTWFKTNGRVSGFMFFDSLIFNGEGIRFDDVQERQDFHVTLSLLELGYGNVVDYEFAVGQYIQGTNAPGGCSTYRTAKFLEEQAELLAKLHPGIVKVIYKQPKVSKDAAGMQGNKGIPDVRVSWARSVATRADARKLEQIEGIIYG